MSRMLSALTKHRKAAGAGIASIAAVAAMRPGEATFHLLANGVDAGVDPITISGDDGDSWDDLPRRRSGEEIIYTVVEDDLEYYSTSFESETDEFGNVTYEFTNTLDDETVAISGEKLWMDDGNSAGVRRRAPFFVAFAAHVVKENNTRCVSLSCKAATQQFAVVYH